MPVRVVKVNGGEFYKVTTPNGTHSYHTTKEKAQAQARLLRAVEHGWRPTGEPRRNRRLIITPRRPRLER